MRKKTALKLLYLSRADVERVDLDMPAIIGLLEAAFREKGEGRVEMPPKPGIHPKGDAFIHAMPACIPGMKTAGMKWVSGFPENQKIGLPYISGLIVLNDIETGLPTAVMDATWVTAHRTGAASALSAKYLARRTSEVLGILACGAQGRTHVRALTKTFPIKRVLAYDIAPDVQRKFVEEMSQQTGLEIIGVDHPKKAVVDSDIVVTSGPILKRPDPVIEKGWLKPGAFASAVDYDSYWTSEALAEMDKLATDDLPQFRYVRVTGYFQRMTEPYADLGEIVIGKKQGREHDHERTMAMNLGLALDDMAVAPEICRRAKERGIGTWLPL
ncbi:MAG: ornithine cyclodeaminase family protein [Candidatus Aminicenantes bacterium]|nr:ornithine cyclodeaminase family protein [Candidatus Aminicenantes bacterium]